MKFPVYDSQKIEPEVLQYWQSKKVLDKLRAKNQKGPNYYFLQGPPYTSGHIHLGHAWNMGLKDMILRYKRMRGFKVWDRMGYDMHGLPTEQKVMAKLGLKNKEDIEKFGLKKFMKECHAFCTEMMQKMNEDFLRLGATLDFTDPYQPISKEFMDAEWWLIKQAHKKKRLYQGLRTMHWDAATQTAVAKHELEYKTIQDTSIYMKFPLRGKSNTFFLIWTTTPWTIPLNLAIMANPELSYIEVEVGNETWILAQDRLNEVMAKANQQHYTIKKKYPGKNLEGKSYLHPLSISQFLPPSLQKNKNLFTVLLSSEYVDASSGTGLVHCAPGCGPEDYEVGHQYGIPPFNCVDEAGLFENFGPFTGLRAKLDDKKFIAAIDEAGVLIAKEPYVHEYPHGERSHQPVIFRTTKQWFFKVEDLKDKLLKANESIYWNPLGGKNAFTSWLENLRDNSITKQRYWGTPVPIWQCKETGDYIVIGSLAELEKVSKQKVKEMHLPDIDKIIIQKDGKVYHRIPDVLDVWIDAGTASWNALGYPKNKKLFDELYPADFILEGKDQIRGWFNLLLIASFLAFDRPSFKSVYMHGFINDASGVKMSKSLGNIISPNELIEKHGADTLRYYMSQTTAGEDINFSWEEAATKSRYLHIFWNVHKFLLHLAEEQGMNPFTLNQSRMSRLLAFEEKYIFSKLHSTIKKVTALLETYRLDEIIMPLEELFLELSRTYIQIVRDKSTLGEEQEKEVCLYTIAQVLLESLKMLSIIAPFIAEAMYLNLKDAFQLKEVSISHYPWPVADDKKIDAAIEQQMAISGNILQAVYNARDKVKLGLRWPLQEIVIITKDKEVLASMPQIQEILQKQANARQIKTKEYLPGLKVSVKPNHGKIGPVYGPLSPQIHTQLTIDSPETIISHLERDKAHIFTVDGQEVKITKEMLIIQHEVPSPYQEAEFKYGYIYLNLDRNDELEAEGYLREAMRNIQQARKDAGLGKLDRIELFLKVSPVMKTRLEKRAEDIQEKVGALGLDVVSVNPLKKYQHHAQFKVKQEEFSIWFDVVE
ncbi:MAG: isoleucyl-tRNA synthetase [archaeon GW2011_AR9]|nr:MAG: isoleucyl-tRNA synthetase [archaeon GW2011_AR9]MBS3120465.1 isoleucine--tRNA ligase [Candidatus Woesearchaeota archaeon]HIH12622.1 isoleucine--tRNA ligase [Candidatus Woesearchaeota archaeon]